MYDAYWRLISIYFTLFAWLVFSIKSVIDDFIGMMLGFLLSTQAINDSTNLRRGYIVCVLIAIIMICADKYLRTVSKTFDIWITLTSPVNIGQRLCKVLYYRRYNHLIQVGFLCFFEVTKILASVYCLVILAIEIQRQVFLNYVLFGILITSSLLGTFLYFPMFLNILLVSNFYYRILIEFSNWYLACVVNVCVKKDKNRITVEYLSLRECDDKTED